MKIYIVQERIDLGEHVLGIFSSLSAVESSIVILNKLHNQLYSGCNGDMFSIEEYDLGDATYILSQIAEMQEAVKRRNVSIPAASS